MTPGARRAPRAIGILGGTFDPVHLGHLALADEALRVLDLERIDFVPNADPPHKQGQPVTPAHHREAMVALAIAADPRFVLSRLELERPGPSYAVDTVAVMAERSRAEGRPEPWFVVSADVLDGLDSWRDPDRVLELCRFAVAPRPGSEALDWRWVSANLPGRESRFAFLPGPELDIAATTVRERVARGQGISDLVPEEVADYIAAHSLYREPANTAQPAAGPR
jgi:nicotinate-nucleotide adenylyltransferase